MTTEEEIKELLQKNLEATQETQKALKNHIKVVRIFTVLKYLLVTGLLAFALVELLPFLAPLLDFIQLLMGQTA